jgi:Xaa-Pro aminopeptidase
LKERSAGSVLPPFDAQSKHALHRPIESATRSGNASAKIHKAGADGTNMAAIDQHEKVQAIAKLVLARLGSTITSTDTERGIAQRAAAMLAKCGIVDTWYHACPALVLAGSRSCLSISGREYEPANEEIGTTTLITVDLSPSLQGVWGDCARTFFLEDGRCVTEPTNPEFRQGAEVERDLHAALKSFVTPSTTFEELYEFANARIQSLGFENLDFLGNFGHSIEMTRTERVYIEEGNREKLSSVEMFTFEPHVRAIGGSWGFKHEDVYYFRNDALRQL